MYINTLTMPRVYDSMTAAGVSRQLISTMWLCGTLAAAVATPFYGRAIDRFGARVCEPAGLVFMAAGMALMSQVQAPLLQPPLQHFLPQPSPPLALHSSPCTPRPSAPGPLMHGDFIPAVHPLQCTSAGA